LPMRHILQCDARNRDEGQHIGAAHPGMGTMMLTHVDESGCLCDGQNCSIEDCRRTADKGNHRTIGGFAGVDSNSFTPFTLLISSVICLITFLSRPSLKLGTHSTICLLTVIVLYSLC
jgi:hypothetical protein